MEHRSVVRCARLIGSASRFCRRRNAPRRRRASSQLAAREWGRESGRHLFGWGAGAWQFAVFELAGHPFQPVLGRHGVRPQFFGLARFAEIKQAPDGRPIATPRASRSGCSSRPSSSGRRAATRIRGASAASSSGSGCCTCRTRRSRARRRPGRRGRCPPVACRRSLPSIRPCCWKIRNRPARSADRGSGCSWR